MHGMKAVMGQEKGGTKTIGTYYGKGWEGDGLNWGLVGTGELPTDSSKLSHKTDPLLVLLK